MNRSYQHSFPDGYSCVFVITLTTTEMHWTPTKPPSGARWLREYRRWRDRCVANYARRTGVLHEILQDDPHRGVRLRHVVGLNPSAHYAAMSAVHSVLLRPGRQSAPGAKDDLLRHVQDQMLRCAPQAAGGSA